MSSDSNDLHPELEQAQASLQASLKEACAVDVKKANTGELIHVEELLAIAGDSAKKVISVRRRLRRDAQRGPNSRPRAPRSFGDGRGVRWTILEVHPSKVTADGSRLPSPFQTGWLSFDSGSETRRLSPIPEDWQLLSDEELRQLCEKATPASRRP